MGESVEKPRTRLRLGRLFVDSVTFSEALAIIQHLVESGRGGRVFTPNVDHAVMADEDDRFRDVYGRAELCVADGVPIVLASRWLGVPLPEKISGSDLLEPLVALAARKKWRVYFLGGAEGVAEKAARQLQERYPGFEVAGIASPRIDMDQPPSSRKDLLRTLVEAKPDLVFVALGAPKQEFLIDEMAPLVRPAVFLGIGASLDFVAGTVARAPKWVSEAGFEWLFRLSQDPKRLWRRYLLRDPKFAVILLRMLRAAPADRRVTRNHPA